MNKRFQEILLSSGYDPDDIWENFKYIGGSGYIDRDTKHSRYFMANFVKTHIPPLETSSCLCRHEIKENCWIARKTNPEDILTVGNCCIKQFVKACKRTCEKCGQVHQNRKDNFCKECRPIKKCLKCNKEHKSTLSCFCKDCRLTTSKCFDCDKLIDKKYKRCYLCMKKFYSK